MFRKLIYLVAVFCVCISTNTEAEASNTKPIHGFDINRGLNIVNWFAQSKLNGSQLDSAFTHEDIDKIVKAGFDYIRIPIDETKLFDAQFGLIEENYTILDDRISYSLSKGLKVIFDLHESRYHKLGNDDSLLFKDATNKSNFLLIWRKLQDLFSKYPNSQLAYECLNEPSCPQKNQELWNTILSDWIDQVREKEPSRYLVCGINRGNQIWALKYLKLPKDDYLILSFHYYQPMALTHYKCSWYTLADYSGPVQYPGITITDEIMKNLPDALQKKLKNYNKIYNKQTFLSEFSKVVQYGLEHHIQVNLGEFGCQYSVPRNARLQWFDDISSACKELGISYSIWGFKGIGFGIYSNGDFDSEIIHHLK